MTKGRGWIRTREISVGYQHRRVDRLRRVALGRTTQDQCRTNEDRRGDYPRTHAPGRRTVRVQPPSAATARRRRRGDVVDRAQGDVTVIAAATRMRRTRIFCDIDCPSPALNLTLDSLRPGPVGRTGVTRPGSTINYRSARRRRNLASSEPPHSAQLTPFALTRTTLTRSLAPSL